VVAEYVEEVAMSRITFTPVVLNAAALVAFLVAGTGKAAVVHRVLDGSHDPDLVPAQLIDPRDGAVHWFLDAAAAARLST
jgi:6-phosphogluconolactonase